VELERQHQLSITGSTSISEKSTTKYHRWLRRRRQDGGITAWRAQGRGSAAGKRRSGDGRAGKDGRLHGHRCCCSCSWTSPSLSSAAGLLRLWPPSPSLSMDQAPPSLNQAPPLTDLGAPTEKSDLELIESIIWEDLARRMGVGVAGGGVGRVVWAVRRRRRWSTPSGRGFGRWVHASITTM
jgi:hypothetical protein